MALKKKYETESEIPVQLKEHYAERDGAWHLALDGDEGSDVDKLRRALDAERKQRADDKRTLAQERDALKQQLTDMESKATKGDRTDKGDNAQIESLKQSIKALQDAVKAADEKTAKAQLEAAETRFLDEVRREAAPFVREEPGVIDDFVERRIRPHFKRNEQGAFVAFDNDTEVYSVKNPGQLMPIKEFIAEVAIKNPASAYMLRQSRGAGVNGNNGQRTSASQFTVRRGAPYSEYVAARTAAEKAGQELQVTDS